MQNFESEKLAHKILAKNAQNCAKMRKNAKNCTKKGKTFEKSVEKTQKLAPL